jgi:double zinc ribbon protein
MKCPRCEHANDTGAKFCEECASPLARGCAGCGRQLSATAKGAVGGNRRTFTSAFHRPSSAGTALT